jgi:hypothetical protein
MKRVLPWPRCFAQTEKAHVKTVKLPRAERRLGHRRLQAGTPEAMMQTFAISAMYPATSRSGSGQPARQRARSARR